MPTLSRRANLAGGVNKAQGSATLVVPTIYQPATVDAVELGTKNTLFDGTLQANLDAWYYNYENYQVGIIDNRAALTFNIPAHLYGAEGEFVWQPDEDFAMNLTLSLDAFEAGSPFIVDQRNPTAGQANSILIKDHDERLALRGPSPITAATGHTPGETRRSARQLLPAERRQRRHRRAVRRAAGQLRRLPGQQDGWCHYGHPRLWAARRRLRQYSTSVNGVTGQPTVDGA